MPLRQLLYFSDLMWEMIKKNGVDLYRSGRINIPTPKFVVFYNGLTAPGERSHEAVGFV